ncbi:MAG: aminodeoxychorismate/anthranilate synthase component II [Candidatus Latescibacterota bacterium]
MSCPSPRAADAPVLFLENEDSFSWNVVDCLPFERERLVIRRGRQAASDPQALIGVGAVVVGPGPTDPWRAGIVELVRQAAARGLPLLGICLGHQALGLAFGAHLVRTLPAHGRQAVVHFAPSRLFPGLVGPQLVMRYHSLSLAGIGPPLRLVACTDDGIPMAVEHDTLPMAGLQFHPDSYATPGGREMVARFFGSLS